MLNGVGTTTVCSNAESSLTRLKPLIAITGFLAISPLAVLLYAATSVLAPNVVISGTMSTVSFLPSMVLIPPSPKSTSAVTLAIISSIVVPMRYSSLTPFSVILTGSLSLESSTGSMFDSITLTKDPSTPKVIRIFSLVGSKLWVSKTAWV